MGANLSTPEKIVKLARSGDSANLQALLADLQRNDAQFQANRARYLEVTDEQGNTPLTLAAARGHLPCVKLLLQFGSSVHHVNQKPDGGSALHEAVAHKHEAVVELLLRHGSNPFVENTKGFTAMDIACSTRNVPLLRRLEQCAPYTGWLLMKVPQFGGLGSSWQRRWVVISHRYPNPQAPPSRQLTHCVFLAYKSLANTAPCCRVWLDGARAREVYNPKAEARLHPGTGSGPRVAQVGVTLHRKHEVPSGVYTTGGHSGGGSSAQEGYTFYLRPDDGSQVSIKSLDKLIRTVNNRGFPPEGPASSASLADAAGATFAAQQQTAWSQPAPPQPGPLYSSLPGAAMANTPGTWSNFEPPAATYAGPAAQQSDGTESDEQIARRLQEEYDAEVARQMQHQQQQGHNGSTAAANQQSGAAAPPAAATDAAPIADYLTGGSFYPPVHHVDGQPQVNAPPARLQQQDAMQHSGSGPSQAANSAPQTPAAVGAENLHSFGRPSAPPLLDLDYPILPLAAGAASAAALASGSGGASQQAPYLSVSSSGRHMSAPRLQDDAWLADVPAAPPSRSSSAPQAPSGAAGLPEDERDDSSVCVFCLDAPATAGVLHEESVHRCLCRDCAVHLKESNVKQCPMCRKDVEAYIMRVF